MRRWQPGRWVWMSRGQRGSTGSTPDWMATRGWAPTAYWERLRRQAFQEDPACRERVLLRAGVMRWEARAEEVGLLAPWGRTRQQA
ncbi:hypothetical protein [Mycolicibacterium tusciae]|uniref:hypothetical protein n=1 Tax=Mycolicibacterium tusciae TaxID=75922 RepID=UPI0009F6DA8A|nr:hypothetical protein [Mycolicibacterium tusciae]